MTQFLFVGLWFLLLLVIPGFICSSLLFPRLGYLARCAVGVVLSSATLSTLPFLIHKLIGQPITDNLGIACLGAAVAASFGLWLARRLLFRIPLKMERIPYRHTLLLLLPILAFGAYLNFYPHIANAFPIHVDEWFHYAYVEGIMSSHSLTFENPFFSSSNVTANIEGGFHVLLALFSGLSGIGLRSLFLLLPVFVFASMQVAAFVLGKEKWGLGAAFFVGLIPTTLRILGPAFLVPVALGMLFVLVLLIIASGKPGLYSYGAITVLFISLILIHPPSMAMGMIAVAAHGINAFISKGGMNKFHGIMLGASIALPFLAGYVIYSSFRFLVDRAWSDVMSDPRFAYTYVLPKMGDCFMALGIAAIVLAAAGTFYAFYKGCAKERALAVCAAAMLAIMLMFEKAGWGVAILYDRAGQFSMLFLAALAGVGLLGATGLAHFAVEKGTAKLAKGREFFRNWDARRFFNPRAITTLFICAAVVSVSVVGSLGVRADEPYYIVMDDTRWSDYEWIKENLVGPSEKPIYGISPDLLGASAMCAVSGMKVKFAVHPGMRYGQFNEVYAFFAGNCGNTAFLTKYGITVVYGPWSVNNPDLEQQENPRVWVLRK
ncbi:MAG: hypothetical protein CVT48_01745 [Thermoplasmata archaeon HGW-Thermoplasmata-1]|nr:MAG: hypothetical protein CVT48_01745 [Thermoplasmata archaeon HGW-Thermoplasmata-1]